MIPFSPYDLKFLQSAQFFYVSKSTVQGWIFNCRFHVPWIHKGNQWASIEYMIKCWPIKIDMFPKMNNYWLNLYIKCKLELVLIASNLSTLSKRLEVIIQFHKTSKKQISFLGLNKISQTLRQIRSDYKQSLTQITQ